MGHYDNQRKKIFDKLEKGTFMVEEQAERFNEGKPQYSLLDLKCLEPGVRVLQFGNKKYARDNWKKGMNVTEILDSLLRHIAALISGELIDPESGLPHIGHIQCNALFLGNTTKNRLDIDVLRQLETE